MTIDTSDTGAASALAILAEAINGRTVTSGRQVIAATDNPTPEEGLSLLAAYVAIDDREIRQAILDTLAGLAQR